MPHTATNSSEEGVKPFACPFLQRSPSTFGHHKWVLCSINFWTDYEKVKLVHICHENGKGKNKILTCSLLFRAHVIKKHALPTYYCDKCFEDLKDGLSLLQHRGVLECEPRAPLYYATDDRILDMRIRSNRGLEESEKWKDMFRILFPGEFVPSPCMCYDYMQLSY